jgi:hypothetical protein
MSLSLSRSPISLSALKHPHPSVPSDVIQVLLVSIIPRTCRCCFSCCRCCQRSHHRRRPFVSGRSSNPDDAAHVPCRTRVEGAQAEQRVGIVREREDEPRVLALEGRLLVVDERGVGGEGEECGVGGLDMGDGILLDL